MSSDRHAEIAGAGLGGLAVAIALALRGWSVRIHERSSELRMFGAGIWLWENGLLSLEALGVQQAATRNAVRIEALVAKQDGRVLMRREFGARDRLLLPPRADLYDALIARAQALDVEIVTDSRIVAADAEGQLEDADGRFYRGDLVVAADGAFSRIRDGLSLGRRIDYLDEGYTRLLIPRLADDPSTQITEYWSGSRRLLYDPCTAEVNYVCLCCHVDDTRGRQVPVDKETWLDSFPELGGVIERIAEVGRWDRAMRVTCRAWSLGSAAIVGDAAHAQPPNLGQGANLTFQNAVAMAAYLDGAPVPEALGRWEAKERPLTDHVQRWTALYGRAASTWPDRLASWRGNVLEKGARIPWIEAQLNKAARHIPIVAA